MADFKKLISESLKSEIEDLTLEEITALIEVPPNKEMGDYAFPCFKLAKVFRKAPNAIAEDLAGKIQPTDDINKIINLGGYVNFFVNKESLAKKVINQVLTEKENYGKSEFGKGKTVVVEFSSPNIAKPFHIGHVRTTVIGNALSKIYASQGYHVEKLNHLGDYGTQFGKLIVAYKLWGDKQAVENDPIKELLKLLKMICRAAQSCGQAPVLRKSLAWTISCWISRTRCLRTGQIASDNWAWRARLLGFLGSNLPVRSGTKRSSNLAWPKVWI